MAWQSTLKERRLPREVSRSFTLRLLYTPSDGVVTAAPMVLPRGETVVGRAADEVDIAVAADPRVSRRHARLRVGTSAQPVQIIDLSSTQTTVNGEPIHEAPLDDGDVIRVGDSFLLFRHSGPAEDIARDEPAASGLLGQAPAMRAARRTLALSGGSQATVLLLGETGTGKELAARALHQASGRAGPFVPVNCSAIAESLAEAQLFGHVAGSYTGAKSDAPGFFQAAVGGTLFLDEVGELTAAVQPKLLRALEDRTVTPVGSTKPVLCDVRVVAATNRDLITEVSARRFRGDLYARLAEFVIEMPPLRERREDILSLLVDALGPPTPEIDPELVEALLLHDWPFNVRELRKLAAQACTLSATADGLCLETFSSHFQSLARAQSRADDALVPPPSPMSAPRASGSVPAAPTPTSSAASPVPDRQGLEALLREHRGVVADVARATERSRKQVYRWLKTHGLDADDFR